MVGWWLGSMVDSWMDGWMNMCTAEYCLLWGGKVYGEGMSVCVCIYGKQKTLTLALN